METKNLEQLKEELNILNKNIVDSGKIHLQQTRKILDDNVKDVINVYSNEIRNIAIISGTIAPFSLALLQTEKINTNIPMLLFGFSMLIINIILAQYFLRRQSNNNDKKLVSAEISWLFADSDLFGIEKNDPLDEASDVASYIKNTDKVNSFLGLDSMNSNIQNVRAELRKQNSIINIIFSAGAFCIVLSVLINPLIELLIS